MSPHSALLVEQHISTAFTNLLHTLDIVPEGPTSIAYLGSIYSIIAINVKHLGYHKVADRCCLTV